MNTPGGAGDNSLQGGAGADIFVWHENDHGTTAAADNDVIVDFEAADKINLSDLLPTADLNNLSQFAVRGGGNGEILYINTNGGASTTSYDLQITTTGNTDDLATLINNNQIIV